MCVHNNGVEERMHSCNIQHKNYSSFSLKKKLPCPKPAQEHCCVRLRLKVIFFYNILLRDENRSPYLMKRAAIFLYWCYLIFFIPTVYWSKSSGLFLYRGSSYVLLNDLESKVRFAWTSPILPSEGWRDAYFWHRRTSEHFCNESYA